MDVFWTRVISMRNKRVVGLASLFVISLFVAILMQVPLSWVVSQSQIKQIIESKFNASQHLKINSSRGTIWNGELDLSLVSNANQNLNSVNISTPNPRNISLGTMGFDLNLLPLLWANLSADIDWQLNKSSSPSNSILIGRLSTNLLASAENRTIHWQTTKGQLQLNEWVSRFNGLLLKQSAVLNNLAGLVEIKQLDFEYQPQVHWFNAFDANLTLHDLNVMNNTFPPIELKTKLTAESTNPNLLTSLNSQQTGDWQLTGKASLTAPLRYQLDLFVTADNTQKLPDWAYLMNKKSSANYVAKFVGRF